MKRRTILKRTAILACALAGLPAHGATYPDKPVHMLVPSIAGSAPDIIARLLAQKLTLAWNEKVIVENRPGGNGIVAMHAMNRAAPDGYTFGLFHAAAAVATPFTYAAADFDIERDSEVAATVAYTPMLLVTKYAKKYATLASVVKAGEPGSGQDIVIGSPTRGSVPNLTIEMLQQLTHTKFRQISFSGTSQAIQAAVEGDITLYIDGFAPLVPLIKSGRLSPVAVTSESPIPEYENIPLAKSTVPGLVSLGWFALFAPKGTPAAILQKMNTEVRGILAQPDFIERLKALGTYPMALSRDASRKFVNDEKHRWEKVITSAGLNMHLKKTAEK